jgi:hypothetical protein
MATFTPQQLKKALTDAGFLVFRTQGDDIILAERVRENLIMDSGVRLRGGQALQVRVVMRAQRGDFPGEDDTRLFDRVNKLTEPARSQGFDEVERAVAPIMDPTDAARTLDTSCEIVLARPADALDAAFEGARFALGLEKLASRR